MHSDDDLVLSGQYHCLHMTPQVHDELIDFKSYPWMELWGFILIRTILHEYSIKNNETA